MYSWNHIGSWWQVLRGHHPQKNDKHWLETPFMQSSNHLPDMAEILQEVRQKAKHIFDKQMTLIGKRIWRTAAFKCKKKKHKFLSEFWKKTEKLVRVWFWYEIDRMNTFQKLCRFIYDSCFLVTIKWRLKKGMIWLKISSGKIFFFVHMTAYCKRSSWYEVKVLYSSTSLRILHSVYELFLKMLNVLRQTTIFGSFPNTWIVY